MPKKKNTLFIVAICLVVVALGAVVGAFLFLHFEEEQAHKPIPFVISVEASDYDPQTASGVPVTIEGTDLDGGSVSELLLLDQSSNSIDLVEGDYVITVAGTPVNAQGVIYNGPETPISLSIHNNQIMVNGVESGSVQEGMSSIELPAITLTAFAAESVTNDQIEAVRAWMNRFGLEEARIEEYTKAIDENKQAALKQIEANKLEAWRTKLTGEFFGGGSVASSEYKVSLSVDGDKLVVKGSLHLVGASYGNSRLSGNEWHFLLTPETTYEYGDEEIFHPGKNEFCERFLPDRFPEVTIQVRDGYVVKICAHS